MTKTMPAAAVLADYAASLRFDALPQDVRQMACFMLKDAVGCAAFGARFEWSGIVADYVRSLGGKPEVHLPGLNGLAAPVPQAALLLGVMAHAFELDNLRKPGAGVHPGATVALPAFAYAMAHEHVTPQDLVTAIVAGCEVMFRIGAATLHTPEKSGFHAPGLTGVFGAATAIGHLLGLDKDAMVNAYGIAGSLGGGLLAFTSAGHGGMVKRLHLGRAAESGVQAAMLAKRGFEGPSNILDGKFGILDAYCSAANADLLTAGLGDDYEILKTCFKRFAAHITAHTPIEALSTLMAEHSFSADDIAEIELRVSDKLISHHANVAPADLASAQYSVPFMVAASLFIDIADPRNVSSHLLSDKRILGMARSITLVPNGRESGWGCDIAITGKNGASWSKADVVYSGLGQVTAEFIDQKYRILVHDVADLSNWNNALEDMSRQL